MSWLGNAFIARQLVQRTLTSTHLSLFLIDLKNSRQCSIPKDPVVIRIKTGGVFIQRLLKSPYGKVGFQLTSADGLSSRRH